MDKLRKTILIFTAALSLFAGACSKSSSSDSDSSSGESTDSSSQTSSESTAESSSSQSESKPEEKVMGERIKKAAAFFENPSYEFVCTVKGIGRDAKMTLLKDKGIIRQTTDYGDIKSYVVCTGNTTYRYDDKTKAFSRKVGEINEDPTGNLIVQTVKQSLEPTRTHIDPQEEKKYDAEEYTYTAGTYITVLDFYFDKTTGELKKYTVTYSIEGKDNEVETREIEKMSTVSADVPAFNEKELTDKGYVHFEGFTEQKREEFCRQVMRDNKITNETLYNVGLTTYDLKTVSYIDFASAVIAAGAKASEK
ncbi:hypothetical protein [Ruminococcus sp. FC2018]|uniref:hypothetical protein n=1 Tax=Ruminococcus sp. FC2018 TaxID=1410617 RepID=UPI000491E021|nr:hypothetical protein [Ruminococcus sp. FC2018]